MLVVFIVTLFGLIQISIAQKQEELSTKEKQIQNIAKLAEKLSDRQHQKYCERFGSKYAQNPEAWKMVKGECVDKLVYHRDEAHLPANFPVAKMKIDDEMQMKIMGIHNKCASLVQTNPCLPEEWANVKKCIRDEGIRVDLFNVGKPNGVMPKNMATISLGLSTSIFECSNRTLQ
ncbi:hypothetical protein RDWZM_010459 [Blomia tropicalis]|uniref:Uncharacterized protein n=1 Tax=Blomia tropicalis TaxID=40697 RepID=A0A9Q0LZ48_BLOTA|nr:hypothetical protein RDWZM_010459 [Blomia tropicalis]